MKKKIRYVNLFATPVPYVMTDFANFSHILHIHQNQWLGLTPIRVKDHVVMADPTGTGYHYLMRYSDFRKLTRTVVVVKV